MEVLKKNSYPRAEHLKSRKQIEQLFAKGKAFSNFPFRVLWLEAERPGPALQTGFTVGSRHFKKAVERNRVKRLMRECYRLQKQTLLEQLAANGRRLDLFFIYVGNEIPDYESLFQKTGSVLNRLIKMTDENSVADS